MYTIENDFLTCTIRLKGAELQSLKCKKTGKEYIWQTDPNIWRSSSPVLFPAIGTIKEDKILYQGESYAMPKHGIIRDNDHLRYQEISSAACSFILSDSHVTHKQYPFAFQFEVRYVLVENSLQMIYSVQNLDDTPLYFQCGGHTAYACPLSSTKQLSDYVVEIPSKKPLESHTIGTSGLLSAKRRTITTENGLLSLSKSLFNKDALIFSNIDYNWVRLREKDSHTGIVVRFEEYNNLALWSKPKADFLCIEPWLGLPDFANESLDITNKSSYHVLAPQSKFEMTIITEIEECLT